MLNSLSHTVDDVTHVGFTDLRNKNQPIAGEFIVVAWFDGEPDLWLVSGEAGLKELRNFYTREWGNRDVPFTISTVNG
jgi:hypothetical protein